MRVTLFYPLLSSRYFVSRFSGLDPLFFQKEIDVKKWVLRQLPYRTSLLEEINARISGKK